MEFVSQGGERPTLEISPHKNAPLFSTSDWRESLSQVITLVESGNFSTVNEDIREWLRQASLVSLWFFLRFVAGYNGPYADLTTHLHVDMCNFYQWANRPSSRAAAFCPRSIFKSSVFTHGGNTWSIVRDPDISIGLGSGIMDRAVDFLHITQRTFDSNEFFLWLFPEFVLDPDKKGKIVDDNFIVPNRTRYMVEPTIKIFAVGGSTQSIHTHKVVVDDPIGDSQLSSTRSSNADMAKIGNWIASNTRTLLINPVLGSIFIVGTRYASDDAYERFMNNIRSFSGYDEGLRIKLKENGEWDIYYRMAEEYGKAIFPERLPLDYLNRIKEDDYWTYITQYMNNPYKSTPNEINIYDLKECELFTSDGVDGSEGRYVAIENDGKQEYIRLSDLYVIQAWDPGATEKAQSAKTSRSAGVVYGRDAEGRRFILDGSADFISSTKMFEKMRGFWVKWKPFISASRLEAQGPFKILIGFLREAMRKWGFSINPQPVTATTDKVVRIRTALAGPLSEGKVYCVRSVITEISGELKSFPDGMRKDYLDAWTIAELGSYAPRKGEDDDEDDVEMALQDATRNKTTGY